MSMVAITYIGHSTALISAGTVNVLTDPCFSERVLILKRRHPLEFDPGSLPELSAIVISHAHYDHLDLNSFKYIKSSVPVFVPVGLGSFLSKFIRNPVIEMNHWSTHKLAGGAEITATYTQHIGFRWSGLRYRKCNGYIISAVNEQVFFAGDTGYGPHFKEIGKTYPIDIAILPIGGYAPRWLMHQRHLNPEEALQAFEDLGAKVMIPIHFGTFRLSNEPFNEPAELLVRKAAERGISEKVRILKSGEKI